jgi:group I intron endonuclease
MNDSSKESNKWIVYRHTCLITGLSYIGYTKKTLQRRWNEHVALANDKRILKKKYCFQNAIKKYGTECWKHEILVAEINSVEEAAQLEKELIAKFNTVLPLGYNQILGGRGILLTIDGKIKHRQATIEALKRPDVRERYLIGIRQSHSTSKFIKNNKLAQKLAQNKEDVKLKKRISMLKRVNQPGYVGPRARPVEQIDISTGKVIATFVSITVASKLTGTNLSKISEVARGNRKFANGFAWRYVNNDRIDYV